MSTDILQLAASGDATNVMRELRCRSLWSPYYLVKVVLDYKQLVPHLHYADSEAFIQRWLGGARKQWIEWPRGFFKSTLYTIGTSIWVTLPHNGDDADYAINRLGIPEADWFARMALHDQDVTQLLAFETIDNAKKKIVEIKWHFEENQLFRELFPEIAADGSENPWNNQCLKIRRVGYGRRLQEGTFEAIGVDGALQSRHYKIVWEDDLVGKKAVESEVTMESTIRWHGLLSGAFENAAEQIRFGVSNRWGYNDLNSHIRKNEPDFVFYTRAAWEYDPSTGAETPIFPERYSLESLKKIQMSGSMTRYDFSCQYLNSPILPGQQEVALSLLHSYTVEQDGRMVCSCGATFYPSQLLRWMHYDPYNDKKSSRSCPAIAAVGTSIDEHIFLLEKFVGRGSYGKIYEKLFDFNDRWRPYKFTYEDVGHQNMTEFHIREMERHEEHKKAHRKFPTIIPSTTGNKPKEVRIRDFFLPTLSRYKFSRRTTEVTLDGQLETFPNSTLDHDYDLLDCLAQGAALPWRFPESDDARLEKKQDEDKYLEQLGKPYSQMRLYA